MKNKVFEIGVVAIVATLIGCKSVQPTIITRDSVRVEYHLDSVYVYAKDSIYVDRFVKGDTIFVNTEKWLTRYKDKIVIHTDTIAVDHSQTIVQEVKYVPTFYKVCAWAFFGILLLIVIYITIKIYKKFKP